LLQRCSRPLCRSQTTSPPTTNPTHTVRFDHGRHQATRQPPPLPRERPA
jgi:hypothetical protein